MTIFVLFLESMSSTLHPIILHVVRTRSYKKKIFFQIFRSQNFAIFFHSFFSFFLVVLKEFKSMGKFSCSYRGIFFFMSEERECKEMGKEGKKIIAMYNFFLQFIYFFLQSECECVGTMHKNYTQTWAKFSHRALLSLSIRVQTCAHHSLSRKNMKRTIL